MFVVGYANSFLFSLITNLFLIEQNEGPEAFVTVPPTLTHQGHLLHFLSLTHTRKVRRQIVLFVMKHIKEESNLKQNIRILPLSILKWLRMLPSNFSGDCVYLSD